MSAPAPRGPRRVAGRSAIGRRLPSEGWRSRRHLEQWQAGLRRLEAAPFDERPVLEQVTREVHAELRRRLGSAFTTDGARRALRRGHGLGLGLAIAAAPDAPFAWDVRIVGDAAFARYLREATPTTPAAGGSRSRTSRRRQENRYTTQARRNPSRA